MNNKEYRKWLIVLQYYQRFLVNDFSVNEIEMTIQTHIYEFADNKLINYLCLALSEKHQHLKIQWIEHAYRRIEEILGGSEQ
ncbi:hypothetical protein ACFFHH_15085 [Cytobacillus solani]|uniref:hypothetical protein n=1 Tax=Cytobacillus solani TaxID=1637975 RepID=UPI0006ABC676|nr:hypothetical protein [Cytobacillus solani]KOP81357.1 hypothetical protein AMS60_01930 [Bacillus sp. FJAT-21945]